MNTFMLIVWIAILVVSAIIEALSVQLITIWFAIGAFAAIIAEAIGASEGVQCIVFVAVSLILILAARPVCRKLLKKANPQKAEDIKIGRHASVTEEINPVKNTGRALLGDVYWNARSKNGNTIPKGKEVTVVGVEDTTLIVRENDN